MKKTLRNKETKDILEVIGSRYPMLGPFSKKDKFEIDNDILIINDAASFFYYDSKLVPSLRILIGKEALKKVVVDMGAVPFVIKGADIMRPGITMIDKEIEKSEAVIIVDETHGKELGLGIALFSGEEIYSMTSGKVLKNIHYVGDRIWTYGV